MTPLVVIVGQTASGKSALAMEIAKRIGGEIICADSWTVYPGFDIGSAKPSDADLAQIPHHLLDIADPREGFSAVLFQRKAKEAIQDIGKRGNIPILAGGTGLYVDSVIYDYGFLPPSAPTIRAELNKMSVPELLSKAEALQLDTAAIDTRNKRRIIRLIENDGKLPTKKSMRDNTLLIGLRVNKDLLRSRIEQRVDSMCAAGLEQEVTHLALQYGWEVEPMKGIGYREWKDYLDGNATIAATKARIVSSTMGLAKRQQTWFKRNDSIHWISPDQPRKALELISSQLDLPIESLA